MDRPEDFGPAFEACRREAVSAFGDDRVYHRKISSSEPHHIEFQILADAQGRTIHLFERECSIQRRHQKIIEETPSPSMTADLRDRMGEAAVKAARGLRLHQRRHDRVPRRRRPPLLFFGDEHPAPGRASRSPRWSPASTSSSARSASPKANPWESSAFPSARGGCGMPDLRRGSLESFSSLAGPDPEAVPAGGPGVRDERASFAGYTVPMEYDPLLVPNWSSGAKHGRRRWPGWAALSRNTDCSGIRTNIPYLRQDRPPSGIRPGRLRHAFHDQAPGRASNRPTGAIMIASPWRRPPSSPGGAKRRARPAPRLGNSAASAWKMVRPPGSLRLVKKFTVLLNGRAEQVAIAPLDDNRFTRSPSTMSPSTSTSVPPGRIPCRC